MLENLTSDGNNCDLPVLKKGENNPVLDYQIRGRVEGSRGISHLEFELYLCDGSPLG